MREGWTETTLGELCTLTKGVSPTLKTEPGKYPLVVTGPEPSSSNNFQFEGEAVCIPMVSSTGHGHASLKRVHYASGQFAVANIITAAQVANPEEASTRFLWLYLQHYKDDLIVTRMKGTANVSLSQKALATVPLQIPPIHEQRRIVDLIGAVDEAIEAADEAQKRSMESLDAIRTRLFAAHPIVSVGELVDGISGGKSPSAINEPPGPGETGVLKLSAVHESGFRPHEAKTVKDSSVFSPSMSVKANDLLITRANTSERVGLVCLVDRDYPNLFLCDKTLRLDPSQNVNPSCLTAALQSEFARQQFQRAGTGTSASMKNISQNSIRSVKVRWPEDVADQEQIAGVLHAYNATIEEHSSYVEALRAVRSNLLIALLFGAHEIPDTYDEVMSTVA